MENKNYSGVSPTADASADYSESAAGAPLAQSESVPSLSKMEPKPEEAGQVKYVKEAEAKNGEATIEIGPVENTFSGMNKEELMKYANDPFWVGIRWFLFILFWVAWAAMLAGAVAIIVLAPRCNPQRADWQKSPLYQVYPRSFQDSDGDGTGDLKGIKSKLDHLVELGMKTVWLSPVYKSPMVDFGYDISDFKDIDPTFGTMEDFDSLLDEMKSKGLKLIMDLVPNHSSNQHPWFVKSLNKNGNYTDYYVWRPAKMVGGTRSPPNNWISVFGGSAWEWSEERQEYYLHQFAKEQPDLNFRNPLVLEEMKNIIRFWLDKGVNGFRVDAVPHLFEDPDFRDEPVAADSSAAADEYGYLDHIYTKSLPEVYDVIAEIRSVLQEYESKDNQHRVMFTEAYVPVEELMKYYGNDTAKLADFPFNFELINTVKTGVTGHELKASISSFLNNTPSWAWPNWVLGNHDNHRVASRAGHELVDALAMVQMLLPGTPVVYYGEEIGMVDTPIAWEQGKDPQGCNAGPERYQNFTRDPERTPMQWDSSMNAGFSNASETWLPVNSNFGSVNVEAQKEAEESHFKVYQALIKERLSTAILYGQTNFAEVTGSIFSFTRIHEGTTSGYLVVINLSDQLQEVDFSRFSEIGSEGEVVVRSVGSAVTVGTKVATNAVRVGPKQGLVLTFTPVTK